ncbi:SDR family oxidoreductase [Celeribacter indicus]|uniref:SDR family oxidoreductase n=1 Tax=Celeribacter indicus TaxID=1208324 RepID=UPI003B845EBE
MADLTDPDQCSDAVSEAVRPHGHLDCLVNNVAIARSCKSVTEPDWSDWNAILNVNLER